MSRARTTAAACTMAAAWAAFPGGAHAQSTGWQRVELRGASPQAQGLTGSSVAIIQSGNAPDMNMTIDAALWAGAPFADANGRATGTVRAWLFSALLLQWFDAGQFSSATPQPGAMFGSAIAAAGNRVVVGSPRWRRATTGNAQHRECAGIAELFTIASPFTAPATVTSTPLAPPAPGPASGDLFGAAVAAHSGTDLFVAAVGAPGSDPGGTRDAGAVHAFRQAGSAAIVHSQALTLPDAQASDRLGGAVAASDVLVLAGIDRDGGRIASFRFNGTSYGAPVLVGPPAGSSGFGRAIALDGGLVAVGAPGPYGGDPAVGTVVILSASQPHAVRSVIPSPFPDECAGFGSTVAFRNGTLVVGTAQGTEFLADGLVAVYRVNAGYGAATLQSIESGPEGSSFGSAVATGGLHSAIGAPSAGASLAGAVFTRSQVPAPRTPDLNGDGVVSGLDLGMLLGMFRVMSSDSPADLNYDNSVDGADLALLLGAWGTAG
jgi:hypothetical protein